MLPDEKTRCHRTGFKKTCRECVTKHGCQLWTQVQGMHPQTGEAVAEYRCADAWMPLLTIENSNMQRQTAAEVESLRKTIEREGRIGRALIASSDVRPAEIAVGQGGRDVGSKLIDG